jgi:DNA topoisomerase-2
VGTDRIRITELPVGLWTDDFKEYLESLTDATLDKHGKKTIPIVKDYDDMSKDTTVDIYVTLTKGKLDELISVPTEHGCNLLEKTFKLYTTLSTGNMHLFDAQEKLKKYDHVEEIIDDYYETRLALYDKRKQHLLTLLEKERQVLSNKMRYIELTLAGTIDLRNQSKEKIHSLMISLSFQEEDSKYLIKMPMDSVSHENVSKLRQEYEHKEAEVKEIIASTPASMWLRELDEWEVEYHQFLSKKGEKSEKSEKSEKMKKIKSKTI